MRFQKSVAGFQLFRSDSTDSALPLRDGRRAAVLILAAHLETLPTGHVTFSPRPGEFLKLDGPFLRGPEWSCFG